jgi:DNA-binding MarR family transcriptional regulator
VSSDKLTGNRREDILLTLRHSARAKARRAAEPVMPQQGQLSWDDLGSLAEGLAFASRPLKLATQSVTQRYDLGPRGAWILNLISNGVVHPTVLSTIFQVGRSLITAELVRLTDAGLIAAHPGQEDRRRSELALTPAGEAACRQIREDISTIFLGNLRGYSAEEIRKFTAMLRDVRGDGVGEEE